MPLLAWIFAGLLLVAIAVWAWRHRRDRPVRLERLWRFPAIMTAVILPLAYLQPHPPFHVAHYRVFALMIALGIATGIIRAGAARFRLDPPTSQLMVGISGWVLLLLLPIGAMRQFAREYLGMGLDALRRGDAVALIGSLLFALAMIVTYAGALHWRGRRYLDRAQARAQAPPGDCR